MSYPAAYPESIAVGAVTDFGCRSNYSQYGPELAFVAPSNGGYSSITTTDRTGTAGYNTASNYTSAFGGTSSATPLSSGIAALVLSRNPGLTVSQVRQILQDTADKVGSYPYSSGRNDRYGYGRINATAAVAAATVCSYAIDPTSASAPAGGGGASVSVTAGAGCGWTAVSNDGWITVNAGSESGTGNGTVNYTVAANTGPSRSGTITIGGQTFTVNQGSGCSWGIDPTSASAAAGGGGGSVSVTASAGCGWTAVSNDAWITVNAGSESGTGNGTVNYTVAANTGSGAQRHDHDRRADLHRRAGRERVHRHWCGAWQASRYGSVAWGDYDNDGDLDILLTGDGYRLRSSKIYRNDGGRRVHRHQCRADRCLRQSRSRGATTTTTATSTSCWRDTGWRQARREGVPERRRRRVHRHWSRADRRRLGSVAWGDYDNDGDLDILLAGRHRLRYGVEGVPERRRRRVHRYRGRA